MVYEPTTGTEFFLYYLMNCVKRAVKKLHNYVVMCLATDTNFYVILSWFLIQF